MSDCAYIHDGYTRTDGYIRAVPRLHPAVYFTFRPMLAQARAVVNDQITKSGAKTGEMISAKAIASCVAAWDVKDADGEAVEISDASAARLQPALKHKLFLIVIGALPPDEIPENDDDASERADRELAAALAGISTEEADAKN